MGLLDQLKRRRQKLQAELAEVERAIAAVEATATVTSEALTDAHHSGNEISMAASLARRKHAAAGAVDETSKVGEFVQIIGTPHAGGPGYTMRSLAAKLREEDYRVSHVTLSRALNYDSLPPELRRPVNPKVAARIKQLTGFPLSAWPKIAASR